MKKLLLLILNSIIIQYAFSQWNSDPSMNNLIANPPGHNNIRVSVSDGSNGSIVLFKNNNGNIYVQKITATGTIAWGTAAAPVIVCNTPADKYAEDMIPDGNGGVYISWNDYRNDVDYGEIYIQHINASGTTLWVANGIRVTNTDTNDDYSSSLCSDGTGGVIITWVWDNYTSNTQLSAQRYTSAGTPQWAANGVQVCTAPGFRAGNSIVADGAGGAIIFFVDTRNDPHGTDYTYLNNNDLVNADIYAQRVSGSGTLLWTNNGVAVCTASGNQTIYGEAHSAISDGNGGAILAFDDQRNDVPDTDGNTTNTDVFSQRLNSNGVAQWAANGVPVSAAAGNQFVLSVTSDGAGGIATAYQSTLTDQVFGQKINFSGVVAWGAGGIAVSPANVDSYNGVVTGDGSGNFIFCYSNSTASLLQAQKLNAAGAFQWNSNGIPVSTNGFTTFYNPFIVTSDNGSVIISWPDNRVTGTANIYASKVLSTGILAGSSSGYISIANGNWNSPATWSGGTIPPASGQVTVRHQVNITSNTTCQSLRVEQPAGNVVVKSGVSFTVTN